MGLKENDIVGHRIPAGTGQREFEGILVGDREEYERLMAAKAAKSVPVNKEEEVESE